LLFLSSSVTDVKITALFEVKQLKTKLKNSKFRANGRPITLFEIDNGMHIYRYIMKSNIGPIITVV